MKQVEQVWGPPIELFFKFLFPDYSKAEEFHKYSGEPTLAPHCRRHHCSFYRFCRNDNYRHAGSCEKIRELLKESVEKKEIRAIIKTGTRKPLKSFTFVVNFKTINRRKGLLTGKKIAMARKLLTKEKKLDDGGLRVNNIQRNVERAIKLAKQKAQEQQKAALDKNA
jgi:hypothetical protein